MEWPRADCAPGRREREVGDKVEIDGLTMTYRAGGEGPGLLLIHGSPGDARVWHPLREELEADFRLVTPDLPGYGGTTGQPLNDAPDIGFAVRLIEGLVAEIGQPAVLAGYSYGGAVALASVLRGVVSPGAVVLFEPVTIPVLRSEGDADGFAAAAEVFERYVSSQASGEPDAVGTMVDFWFGAGAYAATPEKVRHYLREHSSRNARDVRATFNEPFDVEAIAGIQVPVTIVVGGASPPVTHRIAASIATHAPLGDVSSIDGATHGMITTHVDEMAAALRRAAPRG